LVPELLIILVDFSSSRIQSVSFHIEFTRKTLVSLETVITAKCGQNCRNFGDGA